MAINGDRKPTESFAIDSGAVRKTGAVFSTAPSTVTGFDDIKVVIIATAATCATELFPFGLLPLPGLGFGFARGEF